MATDQATEQELQFKKRARRRLVGAVALVLLMVTLLPMLLDSKQDQSPSPDIAISIPSQDDAEFASKAVPPAPVTNPAPANSAELTPSPEKPKETPPNPPPAKPVVPANTAVPAAAVPVATTPVAAGPAVAPADKPVAEAASEEPSQPAAAPAQASYLVQIGLFSDATKAKQLQTKIAELGIKTTALKDGQKTRLRAGPYATKAEAMRAMDTLKAAGHESILVKNK